MRNELTQKELKKHLRYCPETGFFTRLVSNSNNAKVGEIAGAYTLGYIAIRVNAVTYRAHRLAFLYMTGSFPEQQVDHINQVKDDNRWSNLREVTPHENSKNRPMFKCNKSGVMGVYWDEVRKKWKVQIKVNGRNKHLGIFKDKDTAMKKRQEAQAIYGYHENHGKSKDDDLEQALNVAGKTVYVNGVMIVKDGVKL